MTQHAVNFNDSLFTSPCLHGVPGSHCTQNKCTFYRPFNLIILPVNSRKRSQFYGIVLHNYANNLWTYKITVPDAVSMQNTYLNVNRNCYKLPANGVFAFSRARRLSAAGWRIVS